MRYGTSHRGPAVPCPTLKGWDTGTLGAGCGTRDRDGYGTTTGNVMMFNAFSRDTPTGRTWDTPGKAASRFAGQRDVERSEVKP
jgi:hypothetical protein